MLRRQVDHLIRIVDGLLDDGHGRPYAYGREFGDRPERSRAIFPVGQMLSVRIDGQGLPEDAARDFWARFSAWMDAHPGDLGGFARSEGLASVHPEMHDGEPTLVGSRTAPQRAYTTAPSRPARPASGAGAKGPKNKSKKR